MRLKSIHILGFKRFHELIIDELPETSRLVVLAGPNGSGKSSLFDAFRLWQSMKVAIPGFGFDQSYYLKAATDQQLVSIDWSRIVKITFHQDIPDGQDENKKLFYIRSAYRNDPDFTVRGITPMESLLDTVKINRLIDNDVRVGENYQRLVSATVAGVYSGEFDTSTVADLRERYIGQVRESMRRVLGDLLLQGPGDPLQNGSFFFEKGASRDFHYKNLSGGEKAVFDLLLDLVINRISYDHTIYCIDEPEIHLNTRVQGSLLEELVNLIPANCQLWVATHAIGMMRKARELQSANPGDVVFLDFDGHDFDESVHLSPVQVDRQFWQQTLRVALDDLAELIAPSRIVLCEGHPVGSKHSHNAEFDAECYRTIFAREYPDTDFISVGNEAEVRSDQVRIGQTIQTLVKGTTITRVIDRDDRTPQEVNILKKEGVRVLTKRHLEAYLLDDEILSNLCKTVGQPNRCAEVISAKERAIKNSVIRGNPKDDMKSVSGEIYNELKRILGLTQHGNTTDAFLRDTMALLITPDTDVYARLRADLFG